MNAQVIIANPAIVEDYNAVYRRKNTTQGIGDKSGTYDPSTGIRLASAVSVTANHDGWVTIFGIDQYSYEMICEQFKIEVNRNTEAVMGNYDRTYNLTSATAYDIISNNGGIYMLDETSERRENMKGLMNEKKFLAVDKFYKIAMRSLTGVVGTLFALALWGPSFFPREASVTAILVLSVGIMGLHIDKIGWRKKYKCL